MKPYKPCHLKKSGTAFYIKGVLKLFNNDV